MRIQKPSFLTDVSFWERLTKQNIFQILLNSALYLSFFIPLVNRAQLPTVNSPVKGMPEEIGLIFLLSGFGFVYWVSGRYIRFWLMSVRIWIESGLQLFKAGLLANSNKESLAATYISDKNLVRKSDILSYLLKNENKVIEKIYEERQEMNARYNTEKENTVVTFVLLFLHWYFKSELYLYTLQFLPVFLPPAVLCLLSWSSAEPFPEGNNYFYIPKNPIRNLEN
jgi:hypothetical protein